MFKEDTLLHVNSKLNLILHSFDMIEGIQTFNLPKVNLLSIYHKLINYVGCKPILTHLLFCNRFFNKRQKCLMCTRMICCSERHSNFLKDLDSVSINELTADAPDDLKTCLNWCLVNNWTVFCLWTVTSILKNCCISDEHEHFYDINPFGANHPSLIFVNF